LQSPKADIPFAWFGLFGKYLGHARTHACSVPALSATPTSADSASSGTGR
jgi:hypothetical protein